MIRARETIACPMFVLADMLVAEQPSWLSSFLRLACMEGEELAARTHRDRISARVSTEEKAATVDLGSVIPHTDGEAVIVPIRWRVSGYRVLPGRFDGRIELFPHGESTEVGIIGTWAGDLRSHHDFATRLASRAAGEATVVRFLANLRSALEEASRDTA